MGNKDKRVSKSNKPKLSVKEKKAAKKAKADAVKTTIVVPKPAG